MFVCNFSKVAEYLDLKDIEFDIRSAVVLDYYVGGLWWCKQQSYTAEQTSAFYTVIDMLFRSLGTHLPTVFSTFTFHDVNKGYVTSLL